VESGNLVLNIETDLEAFKNDDTLYGDRTITVKLTETLEVEGQLSVFKAEIVAGHLSQNDTNLPLNASYDGQLPVGSAAYNLNTTGRGFN
jgi:hypothetical protein